MYILRSSKLLRHYYHFVQKFLKNNLTNYYRVLLTDSRILVFEEDELYVSYSLEDIIGEKTNSNATILLEEDEYLYIGTDKLFILDLYTDDISQYEYSSEGLNSLMDGIINNFSLLIDEEFNKELWISLDNGISILKNLEILNLIQELKINCQMDFHLFSSYQMKKF